jgi:hypothetical protein
LLVVEAALVHEGSSHYLMGPVNQPLVVPDAEALEASGDDLLFLFSLLRDVVLIGFSVDGQSHFDVVQFHLRLTSSFALVLR